MKREECLYTPYFCEENIWQLANSWRQTQARAVFISNPGRQCAIWQQGLAPPGDAVVWDYHVIMLAACTGHWAVYDFDSRLAWQTPLREYLPATFPLDVEQQYQPLFRVVRASEFVTGFSSDRRHMKDVEGEWLQSPPDWPAIDNGTIHNLDCYVDMTGEGPGIVYDLAALAALSCRPD